MRKIVCVSLCVLLCVPLLVLSAFADDVLVADSSVFRGSGYNITFNALSRPLRTIVIDGVEVFNRSYDVSATTFTISLPAGDHTLSGTLWNDSSNFRYLYVQLDNVLLSTDSSSPTFIPHSDSLTFVCTGNSANFTYYFTLEPVDPLSPVNDGVSTFIGFGGDILHFITNNSAILTLLGLSVALCLVIPFGISKIKALVKGY